jgi:hypothetical protein
MRTHSSVIMRFIRLNDRSRVLQKQLLQAIIILPPRFKIRFVIAEIGLLVIFPLEVFNK